VDAILQATTYILGRDGYAGLTTNRVAERAGVNIASLYQFFPNKAALVAELQRRHVQESRAAADAAIAGAPDGSIEDVVTSLVRSSVASHAVNPVLHRIFAEEMPGHWTRDPAGRYTPDPAKAQLEARLRQQGRKPDDAERIAWMLRAVSRTIVHDAIYERPDDVKSGVLSDDLVKMLCSYLRE